MAFSRTRVQELLHLQIFGNDKETTKEAQQGKQSLWTGCDQGIELYPGDQLHSAFYLLSTSHHMRQKSRALYWFSPGLGHGSMCLMNTIQTTSPTLFSRIGLNRHPYTFPTPLALRTY